MGYIPPQRILTGEAVSAIFTYKVLQSFVDLCGFDSVRVRRDSNEETYTIDMSDKICLAAEFLRAVGVHALVRIFPIRVVDFHVGFAV